MAFSALLRGVYQDFKCVFTNRGEPELEAKIGKKRTVQQPPSSYIAISLISNLPTRKMAEKSHSQEIRLIDISKANLSDRVAFARKI
jgi:hypothetical protein